jgi:hypothetical protein
MNNDIMKASNFFPTRLIFKPLIYGLLTCIIILLIRQTLLTEEMRYTSNWTFFLFLLIPLILSFGAFIYFRQFSAALTTTGQLFQTSLMFGVGAGIAVGLFYYINVTVVDTDYLQKSLNASYKAWNDRGYSKEAIASQVELTDTFQNPIKWSLVLALFYFLLTAGLTFIVGGITYSQRKAF